MKLHTWQRECISAWEKNHFRGIAQVATGAGKTFMAINAINSYRKLFPDARIKIIVPTIPLAGQWLDALQRYLSENHCQPGFFGGGKHDDPDSPVMIYIVNSARSYLSGQINKEFALGWHVLLICDECHHYQAPVNRQIFDFLNTPFPVCEQYAALGLSATPLGTENDQILLNALGPVVYQYNVNEASADEIVSPFSVCNVSVTFLPEERIKYERLSYELMLAQFNLLERYPDLKDLALQPFLNSVHKIAREAQMDPDNPAVNYLLLTWKRKEYSVLAQTRLFCAIDLIDHLPGCRKVLIFCERISQAEQMSRLIQRKFGNICALYHSKMSSDARQRNMEMFRKNHARILVSCRCLDEGIDVPDADIAVVLSGSSVSRQRIQRLGRILRKSPEKPMAVLYYLFIQESADDPIFLRGAEDSKSVNMQYNSLEQFFSNTLYEYAAIELLKRAQNAGIHDPQLKEIRACLVEGLPQTDYLMDDNQLELLISKAQNRHEQNYWKVMKKMHRFFTDRTDSAEENC